MVEKINNILTGVSGEYFVAAELSRMGYVASITLRNTEGIDIMVSNQETNKSAFIQVKTNQGKKKAWMLNKKAEDSYEDDLFYVFVNLTGIGEKPEFHIVPSKFVADYVKRTHRIWLGKPGIKGQPHRDTSMRMFNDPNGEYLEKWKLLGL